MRMFNSMSRAVRRGKPRRGTVLVLALGVLAILSIAALSYVTVVRLERSNVAVAVRGGNYTNQTNFIVDRMRDLLAADLFGNKIVRSSDPDALVPKGPTMFEDGDSRDLPTIELGTFNGALGPLDPPPATAMGGAAGAHFPVRPDDAFLASTEPEWDRLNPLNTMTWRQITNLRSAYELKGNPGSRQWVRGDGRFVDIAEWFMRSTTEYADPSIDLLSWGPGGSLTQLGPGFGQNQDVFGEQINSMSRGSLNELGAVRPSDERQWVDTDGDLRPDARWTILDGMNTVGGLKWFVAARIIDASAFINVNAAIEFGGTGLMSYPTDLIPNQDTPTGMETTTRGYLYLGDGRTPADVDLPRFLERMEQPSTAPYTLAVTTDRLFSGAISYENHLLDGLGMGLVVEDSTLSPGQFPNMTGWNPSNASLPEQRHEFWRLFGQNAMEPSATGKRGGGYSVRELIDLGGFSATNNSAMVSRIEQSFDGTENQGYLPNDPSSMSFGPLRSKEGVQGAGAPAIRRLIQNTEDFNTLALPTATQIFSSVRRMLTPVSGAGLQSPVPVLNDDMSFDSVYSREKVRLAAPLPPSAIEPPHPESKTKLAQGAFEALVWALAPLATNQPLNFEARQAGAYGVANTDVHYGGFNGDAPGSPRSLARTLYPMGPVVAGDPLASYAVITAASMAANLVDAMDAEQSGGGGVVKDGPTLVTLYKNVAPPARGPFESIALGTRLAQGDIPDASLPWVDMNNPMLIVGLERQPFLRDVSLIAVYSDASVDGVGNENGVTGPTEPGEALGSVVRVVLQNPWPTEIQLGPQYQVVIPESDIVIDSDPQTVAPTDPFRLRLSANSRILPGETATFVWISTATAPGNVAWTEISDFIGAKTDFSRLDTANLYQDATVTPDTGLMALVPFAHLMDTTGTPAPGRGVLLTYQDQSNANMPELVIDRMRADTVFPEIKNPAFDFKNAETDPNIPDNLLGVGIGIAYFQTNGFMSIASDPRWTSSTQAITGRALYSTSISRPTISRNGGMPAVVIEAPTKNKVTSKMDAVAWLYGPGDPQGDIELVRDDRQSIINDVAVTGIDFPQQHTRSDRIGSQTFADEQNNYGPTLDKMPVFRLFVPNRPLITSSDMLRICTYAHTCRIASNSADLNDLRHWHTVGEKLGATVEIDNLDMGLGDEVNPYMGVLDPTRSVIGGDLADAAIPNTMRLPLALRVPDCFEAIPATTELVQGRINLNTAPREVIEALPFANVVNAIVGAAGLIPPSGGLAATDTRASLMDAYRGDDRAMDLASAGVGMNLIPAGMRPSPTSMTTVPDEIGFSTPAEAAVLGHWVVGAGGLNGQLAANQTGTFLELGADAMPNDFTPLQHVEEVAEPRIPSALPVLPIDDPEERLALYRAISNIATARSDVFIAWFVMRAYDPQAVERIPLGNMGPITEDQAIAVMDNPDSNFQPVHESRWLVVFDRSQTESGAPLTKPTDRPRVLMKVQLPSSKP